MNPTLAGGGGMPEVAAGFGNVEKIDGVYMNNEIWPISSYLRKLICST